MEHGRVGKHHGAPGVAPGAGASVRTRPLRLAHRGDWRTAPENTVEAFLAAMRIPGCDGIEFDVRLSRDGVPVVIHDETPSRVHGHPGHVARLAEAELVRVGVPTLELVLAALPAGAWLDVELKGDDHGRATAAVLRGARGSSPREAVVSSFEPPTLAAMADFLPGWSRWLNAMDLGSATISLAVGLGCRGISVPWRAITPAAIASATGAGLEVAAWTVRRRPTFERLARLGVFACCVEAAALDG